MGNESSCKEKAVRLVRRLKSDRRRAAGILLIGPGAVLGVVARAAGGSPFQDFTSGVLMGLSAGMLLVGILVTLLSVLKGKASAKGGQADDSE